MDRAPLVGLRLPQATLLLGPTGRGTARPTSPLANSLCASHRPFHLQTPWAVGGPLYSNSAKWTEKPQGATSMISMMSRQSVKSHGNSSQSNSRTETLLQFIPDLPVLLTLESLRAISLWFLTCLASSHEICFTLQLDLSQHQPWLSRDSTKSLRTRGQYLSIILAMKLLQLQPELS